MAPPAIPPFGLTVLHVFGGERVQDVSCGIGLLGGPGGAVSENGRLCHGDGGHPGR